MDVQGRIEARKRKFAQFQPGRRDLMVVAWRLPAAHKPAGAALTFGFAEIDETAEGLADTPQLLFGSSGASGRETYKDLRWMSTLVSAQR